jgi:hypothetical protein
LTLFPAGEIEEMAETLRNLSSLNLQQPDLAHLQYITKIKEAEHISEFGFNKLDLGLSDLASRIFGGLTTLGAGFSTIVLVAGGIFLYCYCRRSRPRPGYAAPQVILPQAVVPQVAPAQPVYQPPSQSTYQAPSSAGHVYQYISPRRFRRQRSRSRIGCCGSRSSDADAVRYSAQTEELAYFDNQSKIKYRVPKYIADEANAAGRRARTHAHKTYATPSSATAAPSAPSHGDLQSRLNTLAVDCPPDYGM